MKQRMLIILMTVLLFQAPVFLAGANEYHEAPVLAKLVSEGKLPPVGERLPENPLVVPVVERIGEYGGTMYAAVRGMSELSYLQTTALYEPLIRWNPENTGVIPGLAQSWEVNEDATVYTITLRKGLKWSDGHPFTTDDLVFYVNDIAKNQKLPKAPVFLSKSGKWSIEKVDDETFTLTFEKPNALFEEKMAAGYKFFIAPAHYAKQFHIKYNPDADKLAKEAGFEGWAALFKAKTEPWNNPECPVLSAWVPKTPLQGSPQFVMERNPYYWKTDPQGNQLPYIDRLVFHNYKDSKSIIQKTLDGEIDFMDRTSTIATVQNKSAFADNQATGNYRLISITDPTSNRMAIILNQTTVDPVMRAIFRNKNFRIGLSLAINRQEIIDTVYGGQDEPWQTSPRKGSGFYNEKLAKQYTEYDVDLANKYLDEAGFAKRDSDGWRLGPDGKRIELEVISRKDQSEVTEAMKLIIPAWRKVGIYATFKPTTKTEWKTLRDNNQAECIIAGSTGGWTNVVLNPSMHITTSNAPWGVTWCNWYNNVKKGDKEEPLAWVKEGLALYDKALTTLDKGERSQLMQQILELSAENFPVIGIALPGSGYGIVSNRLRNVPMEYRGGCTYAQPAASNMTQFFLEGGSSVALGK